MPTGAGVRWPGRCCLAGTRARAPLSRSTSPASRSTPAAPTSGAAGPDPGWSGLVDVGVELVALELQLVERRLHDVADADDAGQLAVGDDRDVPDPAFGHHDAQLVHVRVRVGRGHVAGHDRADRPVEDGLVLVETAYDVALADDAVDGLTVTTDDDGADVVLGQMPEQLAHGRVRSDGHHVLAGLAREYVDDPHDHSSRV